MSPSSNSATTTVRTRTFSGKRSRRANLYLHQLEKAHIELRNPITTGFGGAYPGRMFDCILANPPFSGKVQNESILGDLNYKLNTRATELLFLKWFMDHLTPNGRAGVIVPNGVL